MKSIAIIGGGFSGESMAANLISRARKAKMPLRIHLFDPQRIAGGAVFSTSLPDIYRLNHESGNMGVVNPYDTAADKDDFFNWLQQNLETQVGHGGSATITQRYAQFDLTNKGAYLPRSLYGLYLERRFQEMLALSKTGEAELMHICSTVTSVERGTKGWIVSSDDGTASYDAVVLSTGYYYGRDTHGYRLLKSQFPDTYLHNKNILQSSDIAILGTSLSAIEAALALAEKGHRHVVLYSRGGRLPKVRAHFERREPPFSVEKLQAMCDEDGYIPEQELREALHKLFDDAYAGTSDGLYQAEGINWETVLQNREPVAQLQEDIARAKSGRELRWRSALISLYTLQIPMWDRLSVADKKQLLGKYSPLFLTYLAPMPLPQAELLQKYLAKGVIEVRAGMRDFSQDGAQFVVQCTDGTVERYPYLIDARGPSKDVTPTPLLRHLLQEGILAPHPLAGIAIESSTYQARSPQGTAHPGLYAIGPMIYGARPLQTSTIFFTEFARTAAAHLFASGILQ